MFTTAKERKQLNAHQLMNGSTKCGVFIQWNIIWKEKDMNDTCYNMAEL